jgi:RNA polymerase sigma-70 factor (ECF subfamily)
MAAFLVPEDPARTGMTIVVTIHRQGQASAILATCHGYPCVQGGNGGTRLVNRIPASADAVPQTGAEIYPEAVLDSNDTTNQALEAFFVESENRAFYIAYAALWDREAALDAVQDSMTRLVEYYRHKPATEWPALFRTILNSKINDIRRRRLIEQGKHKLVSLTGLFRRQAEDPPDTTEYEVPAADRSDGITAPEIEYVAQELRGKVAEALQSLSERQRQVFILREWRGMSIKETAQTLGCSENSVKQHHFRALRELRNQLAEVWEHAQPTTP